MASIRNEGNFCAASRTACRSFDGGIRLRAHPRHGSSRGWSWSIAHSLASGKYRLLRLVYRQTASVLTLPQDLAALQEKTGFYSETRRLTAYGQSEFGQNRMAVKRGNINLVEVIQWFDNRISGR